MGSELENIGGTTIFDNLNIKDTKVISKSLTPFLKEITVTWAELNYQDKF